MGGNKSSYDDMKEFNSKYDHYNSQEELHRKSTRKKVSNDDNLDDMLENYIKIYNESSKHDSSTYLGRDDSYFTRDAEEEEVVDDRHSRSHESNGTNKPNGKKKKKKGNFFTRKKYKNTKIIALCLAIVILLSVGGSLAYFYIISKGMDSGDNGVDYNKIDENYLDDSEVTFDAMGDVDADSLNDYLYKWANNGGEIMYDNNIINVLLCGVDSENGDSANARSDSMILVSINKETEKIKMVSLLRDSWTYIKIPQEDGTYEDYYFKMNSAYMYGGPATLLETLQNDFKVRIDQYVAVDFVSFPKLIDALGGVKVDVQDYEVDYIRRTSRYTDFPYGSALLSGDQALVYSRIRHCDTDSDVSRTRRQRAVIKALITSAKTATNGQLVNAFKQVATYLRTGYTQTEVLSLIAQAYSHNWMKFEMSELMLPKEDYTDRVTAMVNGQSAWVVDYSFCAQELQQALYGKTNIVLNDDRVSALDFFTDKRNKTTTYDEVSDSTTSTVN